MDGQKNLPAFVRILMLAKPLTSCALLVVLKQVLQTGSGLMESVALPHHYSNEKQAAVWTAGTVTCISVFHREQSPAPQCPGISCAVEKSQCHFHFSICFFSVKAKEKEWLSLSHSSLSSSKPHHPSLYKVWATCCCFTPNFTPAWYHNTALIIKTLLGFSPKAAWFQF